MSIAASIKKGLLYKVWKFKYAEPPASGGLSMASIPYPEIFDLTIVGTLLHSKRKTPDVIEIGYYELINESLEMVIPGKTKSQVAFKISELTEQSLKLTMHLKMDGGPNIVDTDVVIFAFEAQ